MDCPVCKLELPQQLPPFCPQCAWDLKSDFTLNVFLDDLPKSIVEDYDARIALARQNWERIQLMKQSEMQHVAPEPLVKEEKPGNDNSPATPGKKSKSKKQNTANLFELPERGKTARVNMMNIAKNYKMFIDTSSLLEADASRVFLKGLLPLLQQNDATVCISGRTIDHLEYLKKGQDQVFRTRATEALNTLRALQDAKRLLDAKDPHPIPGDPFDTSSLFTELFVGYQMKFDLCLITQNETLAQQVINNSRSEAFSYVKQVETIYIDGGEMKNWIPRLRLQQSQNQSNIVATSKVSKKFKIIADTSSILLNSLKDGSLLGTPFFKDSLLPEIAKYDNKLIIPNRVIKELTKHTQSGDQALVKAANEGLSVLMMYEKQKLLVIGEDAHEVEGAGSNFADPVFVRLAIRFQSSHDMCFITQDRNLAITLLGNRQNGTGHEFFVAFIPQEGRSLIKWESKLEGHKSKSEKIVAFPEGRPSVPKINTPQTRVSSRQQDASDKKRKTAKNGTESQKSKVEAPSRKSTLKPFELAKSVYKLDTNPIPIKSLPGTGGMVLDSKKKPVLLIEELAEGGEGKIYRTGDDGLVCKIYHEDRITESRKRKLELMVSRDISIPEVCWPKDIATNEHGQFVGYLMPKVGGKILKTSVFAKPLLKKSFPHWTRIELTQLAITILSAIRKLHRLNIFIGDINPQNVLVTDERSIALVDADSFQVEGFPCPVGTETFTPPERQGTNYADFLRSEKDELFAVTTLLFMILFVGKAPYSSQGGGEAAENIRNRAFAYDRETDERPPVGAWQFIWSQLHYAIKADFHSVFSKGERVAIESLIDHLNLAIAAMKRAERSADLFPDKPWQRQGETVKVKCGTCGKDYEINRSAYERLQLANRHFKCNACVGLGKMKRLETTREVECSARLSPNCAGRVAVPIEHLDRLAAKNEPYVCHACNEQKNYRIVKCGSQLSPNCVRSEKVSVSHLDNLKAQNQVYWCRACQEAERARRGTEKTKWQSTQRRPTARGTSYSKTKKKSGCFIATATYGSSIAPQVVVFREYRDEVLLSSSLGRHFIDLYYCVGPWFAALVKTVPILRPVSRRLLDMLSNRIQNRFLKDLCDKGDEYGR